MRNKGYQYMMVILFSLAWGFVFLDSFNIGYLMPILVKTFHLNNAQVGQYNFVQATCATIFMVLGSILVDRSNYRLRWLVPTLFLASLFSALCAIAPNYGTLIVFRGLTAVFEGPVIPIMFSLMSFDFDPKMYAVNIGIINIGAGVIMGILGPIITTQLAVRYSWHIAFVFTCVPTMVIAILLAILGKEVERERILERRGIAAGKINWREFGQTLRSKNIVLCLVGVALVMSSLMIGQVFGSLFFVKTLGMPLKTMGYLMSIVGAVGIGYNILTPILSDRFGRKPITFIFCIMSGLPTILLGYWTMAHSSFPTFLVYLFALIGPAYIYMVFMFVGVIGVESTSPAFATTIVAVINGFGGVVAGIVPILAGMLADRAGLPITFVFSGLLLFVAAALSLLLNETSPRVLAKRKALETPGVAG